MYCLYHGLARRSNAERGLDNPLLIQGADHDDAYHNPELACTCVRRRQAILQGLSSLGYEVRERMATTFAKGEAVVMQHTTTLDFGLEVSGQPEAQRLQMRVVAFGPPGAPRDSSRDRDIELQWCGDLDKLQDMLGHVGGEIAIERSVAAGAQPLKVIEHEQHRTIDQTIAQPRQRTRVSP